MYDLYLGTRDASVAAEDRQTPASLPLKLSILSYLSRSKVACDQIERAVAICSDSINGPETNERLRKAGIAFIFWILRIAELETLGAHARMFFESLMALLNDKDKQIVCFAYDSISILCRRGTIFLEFVLLSNQCRLLLH